MQRGLLKQKFTDYRISSHSSESIVEPRLLLTRMSFRSGPRERACKGPREKEGGGRESKSKPERFPGTFKFKDTLFFNLKSVHDSFKSVNDASVQDGYQ